MVYMLVILHLSK